MSEEAFRELKDILARHDRAGAARTYSQMVSWRDFLSTAADRQILELALTRTLEALCPPPCREIDEAFWDTDLGDYIATVQFALYADDLISKAEAARLLYRESNAAALMNIERAIQRGEIRALRRPRSDIRQQRVKGQKLTTRRWLVRRSDVEKLQKSGN